MTHLTDDEVCIAVILPDSLMRAGTVLALSHLGVMVHVVDDPARLEHKPNLLVSHIDALPDCAAQFPDVPVLIVSLTESDLAGATPATSPEAVMRRVRELLPNRTEHKPLSRRELEVLTLVASGLSASEIATQCFISTDTVKTHLSRIYRKLGANDRASAVVRAIRSGALAV